jgi:CRP/FNR family transcriptional regulator, cyclic AMP receptor protein
VFEIVQTSIVRGAPGAQCVRFGAMARRDAYIEHLGKLPFFASLSKRDLQKVAKASDELTVAAGRKLVDQGAVGREAFVILEGTAVVKRGNRKVATLGPGDYFGELALLDHGPRTATVIAETDMTVLVIGAREFAGVIDDVPNLSHKLLKSLASRIRELDAKAYG